jgi:hypothetical protein
MSFCIANVFIDYKTPAQFEFTQIFSVVKNNSCSCKKQPSFRENLNPNYAIEQCAIA